MASPHLAQLRPSSTVKTASESLPRQSLRPFAGNGGPRLGGPVQSTTDFRIGENFQHLKLTAEKMMQEQACIKSDLEIMYTKLQKSDEQVRALESKVQNMNNENAMLKVQHKQDMKLWKGLDSKFLATTTFCDQLAETLQLLDCQVQEAEMSKKFLEEKLAERLTFFQATKSQVNDLLQKKEVAEESLKQCEASSAQLHLTLQELQQTLASESVKVQNLAVHKEDLQQQLTKAMKTNEEDAVTIRSTRCEIQDLQKDIVVKAQEATQLQHLNLTLMQGKGELDMQVKDLQNLLATALKDKDALQQKLETLTLCISDLEKVNASAAVNIEVLLAEKAKCNQQMEENKFSQEKVVNELKQQIVKNKRDAELIKGHLQKATEDNERLVKIVAENESRFGSLHKEANQLRKEGDEKIQLMSRMVQNEESLRLEIEEMQVKLAGVENDTKDRQRKFNLALEAKQTELSKHLQEISQRNNKEMADMRRKFEAETQEAIAKERLKGVAALKAVEQASCQGMAKELEAFNSRCKSVQEDHDRRIRNLQESHDQEKAKIAALHAEELHKKQMELRIEMEKRNDNIAKVNEFQLKVEELQKSHQEEIGKFEQDYQDHLLKSTAEESSLQETIKTMQLAHEEELARKTQEQKTQSTAEESSLQETIKTMQLAHEEELARKTQEQKTQFDRLEKDRQSQVQNLQKSLTKDIDEWRSKALWLENQWKEALKNTAREVSKDDKQTQITNEDFTMTEAAVSKDIRTPIMTPITKNGEPAQQTQTSTAKTFADLADIPDKDSEEKNRKPGTELMQLSQRSGKRKLDLLSPPEENPRINNRTSILPSSRKDMADDQDKEPVQQNQTLTALTTFATKDDEPLHPQQQEQSILSLEHYVEDLQKKTSSTCTQALGLVPMPGRDPSHHKISVVRTSQLHEGRHKTSQTSAPPATHLRSGLLQSQRPNVCSNLGIRMDVGRISAEKEAVLAIQVPTPNKKGFQRELDNLPSDGKPTAPKRRMRKATKGVAHEESLEESAIAKSTKKGKFFTSEDRNSKDQPTKALSPPVSNLFHMDGLDPYYTGDDPYAFS